jgi:Uma2 family endonuclease
VTTLLKLGPTDHNRVLTLDEFWSSDHEEGYRYELIDGRLYVSPRPNLPFGILEQWIYLRLAVYAAARPAVINFVHPKARVFVPNRPGATVPEPDAAAYHDFPIDADFRTLRWEDYTPVVVVEVVSEDDPEKDLVRNVDLYLQVPAIKEYWIVDGRADPNHPTLTVHRRERKRWRVIALNPGDVYTTKLLPDFKLIIDPRR